MWKTSRLGREYRHHLLHLWRGLRTAFLIATLRAQECQQVYAEAEQVHLEKHAANTPPKTAVHRRAPRREVCFSRRGVRALRGDLLVLLPAVGLGKRDLDSVYELGATAAPEPSGGRACRLSGLLSVMNFLGIDPRARVV